jgi:hypothetical protein
VNAAATPVSSRIATHFPMGSVPPMMASSMIVLCTCGA